MWSLINVKVIRWIFQKKKNNFEIQNLANFSECNNVNSQTPKCPLRMLHVLVTTILNPEDGNLTT